MKFLYFFIFSFFTVSSYSQVECFDEDIAEKCEIDTSYQIFDYFNHRIDSLFCLYGRVTLMDCSPYYLYKKRPIYITRKLTYKDGSGMLDIFIDDKLLFRYYMINGRIEGSGYIFYPQTGHVAYQGYFSDGKLNGPLFCLSKDDSEVIHSILFKNGSPKKILFLWNLVQTNKNYKKINKQKFFKNGQCVGEVEYPFLRSMRTIVR